MAMISVARDGPRIVPVPGRVVGVDPDERMADVARRGGLAVEVSTIETWDPAGRVFDAAVAAQAWHWVDPVAGAAHFAVPDARAVQLAQELNATLPGYLVPRLVREIPGEPGKTPL